MGSFNKLRRFGIVFECFSYLLNSDFKNRVTDKRFRPDGVQQLVFGYELARPLNEVIEEGKGFGSDLERFRASPQTFINEIERKAIEGYSVVVRDGIHRGTQPPLVYRVFLTRFGSLYVRKNFTARLPKLYDCFRSNLYLVTVGRHLTELIRRKRNSL